MVQVVPAGVPGLPGRGGLGRGRAAGVTSATVTRIAGVTLAGHEPHEHGRESESVPVSETPSRTQNNLVDNRRP